MVLVFCGLSLFGLVWVWVFLGFLWLVGVFLLLLLFACLFGCFLMFCWLVGRLAVGFFCCFLFGWGFLSIAINQCIFL